MSESPESIEKKSKKTYLEEMPRHHDDFGVDLDLLKSNLSSSYEDRILQHHAAYLLLIELENARDDSQS